MIEFKEGNAVDAVLNGEVDFLLQVVNCQGVMGSGIALEIKNKIPEAYTSYKRSEMVLGNISGGRSPVINLHAQFNYGRGVRQINYGGLSKALMEISDTVHEDYVIGFPYLMGADRAGGDWEIIKELIEFHLKDYKLVCYKFGG